MSRVAMNGIPVLLSPYRGIRYIFELVVPVLHYGRCGRCRVQERCLTALVLLSPRAALWWWQGMGMYFFKRWS